MMRIYVDFDDCLCETGRAFSKLALEMFDKHEGFILICEYGCNGSDPEIVLYKRR